MIESGDTADTINLLHYMLFLDFFGVSARMLKGKAAVSCFRFFIFGDPNRCSSLILMSRFRKPDVLLLFTLLLSAASKKFPIPLVDVLRTMIGVIFFLGGVSLDLGRSFSCSV